MRAIEQKKSVRHAVKDVQSIKGDTEVMVTDGPMIKSSYDVKPLYGIFESRTQVGKDYTLIGILNLVNSAYTLSSSTGIPYLRISLSNNVKAPKAVFGLDFHMPI